ncbi:MAG: hypothetical protein ISQ08_11710 [Planctomycetes bacterium]|nr:hypothetical protein [Planctomycetota bacterium]MDA0948876.1 hypothetical protein [Planctomycetota bacterium]
MWRPASPDPLRVARQLLEEDPLGLEAEARDLLADGGLMHDPRELFECACAIAAVEALSTPRATPRTLCKRALAGALRQLEGAVLSDAVRRLHRSPLPERLALLALLDGAASSVPLARHLHARRGLARLGRADAPSSAPQGPSPSA